MTKSTKLFFLDTSFFSMVPILASWLGMFFCQGLLGLRRIFSFLTLAFPKAISYHLSLIAMKSWSRFNTLFWSKRSIGLLYNALSNVMLEIDEKYFRILEKLREKLTFSYIVSDQEFVSLLEIQGFLSDTKSEQIQLSKKHYRRSFRSFDTTKLRLTLCPTLACNFSCSYCFEQKVDNLVVMNDQTMDKLIAFIQRQSNSRKLSVNWYGGEPTLAFQAIVSLTKRILEIFPNYNKATLITNGFLLDKKKIDQLNDLKIHMIQITLDGCASTHDKRRVLKNGGSTFNKILDNIDMLVNSTYQGKCAVRMNIDKTNQHEYLPLRNMLLERYKNKQLSVYPGRVAPSSIDSYSCQDSLCIKEWSDFTLGTYYTHGIVPIKGFYPQNDLFNICTANSPCGYVIGPEGEIYKCWKDVGNEQMVVGTIHNEVAITNQELITRYSINTDPFNDNECMRCPIMPICGGGCVHDRLKSQEFGEATPKPCSSYKDNLEEYLEAHYDTLQTIEMCEIVLGISQKPTPEKGYRMLSAIEIEGVK